MQYPMARQKLINARTRRKLSQEEVAEAAKISRRTLGACERGEVNPREDTIELICAFFQMRPEELDLEKLVPTSEQQPLGEPFPESVPALANPETWYNQSEQSGFSSQMAPMHHLQTSYLSPVAFNPVAPVNDRLSRLNLLMESRRQALSQLLNGAWAIFTLSPYAFLPHEDQEQLARAQILPSYLDEKALDNLSHVTATYWALLGHAPLDTLVGVASRHFETILYFLKDSHSTHISKRLCVLASESAQLLGVIFRLIKEYDLSYTYYTFALKAALDIGHTDLWAVGIGRMAHLHLYWGDPGDGLPLLQAVERKTIHDPRLRAYLSAIEAEIYAEMEKMDACLRLLDKAKSVTVSDHLHDDIYWTGFNPSLAAGFEGACYVRLHQPDKALDPLQQSLALCDPAFIGERSARTVDIGNVHAQLEDPKKACEALGQALDWIAQRRSLSGLRRVYKARAELWPWKKSAEVQALDYRLHQTVKALSMRT